MYLDYLVDVPEVKGKITFRSKGNARYVYYEYDKIYDPDKKYMWIFLPEVEREGRRVNFNKKDYYDQIPGGEINKNPLLVRNDGH